MSERARAGHPGAPSAEQPRGGLLTDDPRAAFEIADVGLETARRLGFRDIAVRLASNWAEAALDIGAWDQVLATWASWIATTCRCPDRIDLGSVVATILTWRGESDADGRFGRLDALLATQPDPLASSVLLSRRSLALLSLGRAREALAHTEATTLARSSTGLSTLLLENSVLTSRAALWAADRGSLAGALDAIRAVGPRGRWLTAVTTTLAAGLDALDGRTTAARDGYGLAAARWRTLDVPLQLALCQVEAAHFLPTGTVEAAAAADEARAILAGLGATGVHREAGRASRRARGARGHGRTVDNGRLAYRVCLTSMMPTDGLSGLRATIALRCRIDRVAWWFTTIVLTCQSRVICPSASTSPLSGSRASFIMTVSGSWRNASESGELLLKRFPRTLIRAHESSVGATLSKSWSSTQGLLSLGSWSP